MAMLNVLEMDRLYRNQWVVLDRSLNVVDSGSDLQALRTRYSERLSHYTLYFVPGGNEQRRSVSVQFQPS